MADQKNKSGAQNPDALAEGNADRTLTFDAALKTGDADKNGFRWQEAEKVDAGFRVRGIAPDGESLAAVADTEDAAKAAIVKYHAENFGTEGR